MLDEGKMVHRYKIYLISVLLISSCGGLDRVDTIKGPPGPKGDPGLDGRSGIDGRDGNSTPAPQPRPEPKPAPVPEPQEPKTDGRNGIGANSNSVIIYNGSNCIDGSCAILVCACVDKSWRTIMISRDQATNYKIKIYGRCSDDLMFDEPAYCRVRPLPSPQPLPAPTPKGC